MANKVRTVGEEIRQTKPFDSRAEEAILTLYRTADAVQRDFTTLIEPHGISAQQYNVLRILRGAGSDGLPTLEIADRMIERTPGITRLLDGLESSGFVCKENCATDARVSYAKLTDEGFETLRRASVTHLRGIDDLFVGRYSEPELATLAELLSRLPLAGTDAKPGSVPCS